MTSPAHPAKASTPVRMLPVDDVMHYGRMRVAAAAAAQWPGATIVLASHVPSVTSYVRRLTIDRKPFVAKFSFLGKSLSSVLRGDHGIWDEVKAAQAVYESRAGHLLERQAVQYALLRTAGLGAPRPMLHDGVLFTEEVTGRTLGELVVQRPTRSGDLLIGVMRELEALVRDRTVPAIAREAAIPACTVTATFERKFTRDPLPDGVLGDVVGRLRERAAAHPVTDTGGVVFGDLKPEHVLVTGNSGRPVFLDPGLSTGPGILDVAKLVSRLVLHTMSSRPRNPQRIVAGINDASQLLARRGPMPSGEWLQQLVLLWAMDTACLIHTVRTAPAMLPLPAHLSALDSVEPLALVLIDRMARALEAITDGNRLWMLVLDYTTEAINRTISR
ncbi:hypothetical protein [Streptomyces qinzhouensis]|uniref:Phosphotransferase n=1 Tax=Streptomyces qinzhouensis TaxID=2599401 RepID=A0A5B8IKR1_9ACTN|nr:hypothetical protein [Streptomyces qinzhouensis]QDY79102.1 hypothetical protein FQU76_24185 [Streptomyces qinzhouensis]